VSDTFPTSSQPASTGPGSGPGTSPGLGPDLAPEPVPVVTQGVKPRSRSARIVNLVLALAVGVAVAGIAFAVGRGTAPAAAAGTFPRGQFFTNGQGNGGNGQGGNGGQGGPGGFAGAGGLTIQGTVSAVTADSVTIKTAAGAEITVSTSGDTTYHQQAAATSGDVKSGSTVLVRVDGFRGRFGGGGPGASPAPSGAPRTNATATDITVVP
jgi:hypothetical protein